MLKIQFNQPKVVSKWFVRKKREKTAASSIKGILKDFCEENWTSGVDTIKWKDPDEK